MKNNFAKLIAAIVSIAILFIQWKWRINLGPVSADIVMVVAMLLNPVAVWFFKNTPKD
jgi:hypothetical protein